MYLFFFKFSVVVNLMMPEKIQSKLAENYDLL